MSRSSPTSNSRSDGRAVAARALAAAAAALAMAVPPASAEAAPPPRWRGFNLTDLTRRDHDGPHAFREGDFDLIARWGFNFVRLPLTYEHWVDPADWRRVDETRLGPIDAAVRWGRAYGLHVCLNFHRAPGHCINPPAEPKSLWTDADALAACAAHWAVFARRYRHVPADALSFNLLNEPPHGLPADDYRRVVLALVDAVRAEDPGRPIVVDGLDAGRRPPEGLGGPGAPQALRFATRGYEPWTLTHHRADWAPGNDRLPAWPPVAANRYLYGPWKPELHAPLVLRGQFPAGTLRVTVGTVADFASLHVLLDGRPVLDEDFLAAKGGGTAPPAFLGAWKIHQTRYDRALDVPVPEGTRSIRIEVGNGDWITLGGVEFVDQRGQRAILPFDEAWGEPQPSVRFGDMVLRPESDDPRELLRRRLVAPWADVEAASVVVGEWGAYNRTPHAVTLRWMEDCLAVWQEAGWGWALWNFRGDFGILDSGRSDVEYEDFEGHRLDRRMLELLRRY